MHILLAMQVALWSPVMCCCAIKGAIGTVAGTGAGGCQVTACCASQIEDVQRSCCGGSDEMGACDQRSDKKDGNCRCHERIASKVQLDTGGKIHVPVPQIAMFIAAAPLGGDASAMPIATIRSHNLRSHPPPSTLLSQRCLLLI